MQKGKLLHNIDDVLTMCRTNNEDCITFGLMLKKDKYQLVSTLTKIYKLLEIMTNCEKLPEEIIFENMSELSLNFKLMTTFDLSFLIKSIKSGKYKIYGKISLFRFNEIFEEYWKERLELGEKRGSQMHMLTKYNTEHERTSNPTNLKDELRNIIEREKK